MNRVKVYPHAWVSMERTVAPQYVVRLYIDDKLEDKIRVDNYRVAMEYWTAFNKIARAA